MRKILLGAILVLSLPLAAASPDAIPWENNLEYPQENSVVNLSYLNRYDIDHNGQVFIKDSHFWTQQGRINFFGTNLTFDACFPEKETAEKIANQLSGLGINIVRLHHMDNRDIWGKYGANFQEFDPEQLKKLDYLIFCLKQKGIYIDLNLHVSWQYTNDKKDPLYNLIRNQKAFKYGKGLDTFLPELIAEEKTYARQILNHVNQYTGLAYKDDPVTALVEINNENSFYRNLIVQDGLDLLPEEYHHILDRGFQQFVAQKYHDMNNLRKAWEIRNNDEKPVPMPGLLPMEPQNNWRAQISDPQKGTIVFQDGEAVVHLNYLAKNQFFQFYRTNLSFKKGDSYAIVIDLTGKSAATLRVNAMRQGPPYGNAGLNQVVRLKDNGRQTLVIPFKATQDLDHLGRITFSDFNDCTDFVIHAVRVYQGKYLIDPLQNVTKMDDISLPTLGNFPAFPDNYQNDLVVFFRKMELDYWSGMIGYLKNEVGLKVPITGTQIDYSFPELAKVYDYVDIHAYWQHPSFPGKPWDGKNYYVRNISMVASPKTNFDRIALYRIKGKPFTISEYNHPYPNLHITEAPTMLAVMAKFQDYDGVFSFNFLNNLEFSSASFFSHYTKFACKAVYPAAAFIFRDPGITALPDELLWDLGENETFKNMKEFKTAINPYLNELLSRPDGYFDLFKTKHIAMQLTGEGKTDFHEVKFTSSGKDAVFNWENSAADYQRNFFKYDAPKAKVYIGWNVSGSYDFKNLSLKAIDRPKQYFQFTIINLNGPIGGEGRYIVTLTGREFYTNVNYYDYDTKALLDPTEANYGTKIMACPTAKQNGELIENFTARLCMNLLKPYRTIRVSSINTVGEQGQDIPFEVKNDEESARTRLTVDLNREDKTVIYTIEVKD